MSEPTLALTLGSIGDISQMIIQPFFKTKHPRLQPIDKWLNSISKKSLTLLLLSLKTNKE